jgi:signal transduction histidine kinase/CheY-like chemotaxis protein/HPt (histidine-containing phosphotransfer) domain-containing protein
VKVLKSVRNPFRQRTTSLAGRLALAVFGSVALALVVGTLFGLWQEVARYADDKRDALTAVAGVFAASGARATATGDGNAARETLRAIARRPDLIYAGIERPDGSTLADHGLAIRLASDLDLDRGVSVLDLLGSRTVQVRLPIVEGGRPVGSIVLVADTADLTARLLAIVRASLLASVLALGLGLAVSYALQRSITRPIAELAETMERVRADADYSRHARIERQDEVGVLAGTFNSLLETVRERDARLARHRDRLEQDVADRTADLSEAKEAAEAANTAKSSFLATMSHEIRTPLNGMLVMAELLAQADLPDRQKRYAEVVARSGQSLLAIINDILDFAKVEAGKLELERIAVRPGEVADIVVSLFGEKAREKGLDLAAYVAPAVPRTITGDPVRLGQVLSNFVNNALKFTEAGSVLIRLDFAGGRLRLAVKDTGIGIPAEKLPTVFTAFSQADQSTTRRFGGTGLGLSIAQRLIEAMGGSVGVESVAGEGSTFWAEIPLDGSEIELAPPLAPAAAGIVVAVEGGATATALRQRLYDSGFTVLQAGSEEAQAAHWIIDASALATLAARPGTGGIVFAIAGMGDPAAGAVIDAAWADDLLRWPVVQEELDAAIAALSAGLRPSRSTARRPAAAGALPQFPAARILVADDSAVNREVAIEALARCGITDIVTVADGQAAVEAVQASRFDLVLMDGSMPVLDGYAAALAIRAWETEAARPRLPIVALTAHVIGSAATAWEAAGMDATLTKPFTLAGLAALLGRFLDPAADSAFAPGDRAGIEARPEGSGLLDEAVLGGLADMARTAGGAFAERILGLYEEHAPLALAELHDASVRTDVAAAASAAHSLKSMSLNIGGRAIASTLARIEGEARSGGACPTLDAVGEVEDLLARTLAALKGRLGPGAGADTAPLHAAG